MPDAMPQTNLFSPVDNNGVLFKFEGGESSSDAGPGLMLLRRIEQQLGLFGKFASRLSDPRDSSKTHHSVDEIIRFRFMMIVAGHEDSNVANKLRHDSSFRLALEQAPETGAALCS